jgi:hypothetical protein
MTDENAYAADGWKEFPTEAEANDYAALTWAQIVHTAPETRIPAEFLALKAALDGAIADAGDIRSVPGDGIRAVSVVPLKGLNHLGEPVDAGYSRKWADPLVTAAGTFAMPCLAGFDVGGPMPPMPPPPPGTPLPPPGDPPEGP